MKGRLFAKHRQRAQENPVYRLFLLLLLLTCIWWGISAALYTIRIDNLPHFLPKTGVYLILITCALRALWEVDVKLFHPNGWPSLRRAARRRAAPGQPDPQKAGAAPKTSSWALLLWLAVVLMLTLVLNFALMELTGETTMTIMRKPLRSILYFLLSYAVAVRISLPLPRLLHRTGRWRVERISQKEDTSDK